MNILYLTTRFPFPLDKGDKLRDYHHIKGLSKNHSITLVSFATSKTKVEHEDRLQKYCDKIILVRKRTPLRVLKTILSVGSKLPFQVTFYKSKAMAKEVHTLLSDYNYDLLYTHLIRMAQYFINIKNIPKVIDISDAISKSLSRRIEISNIFMRQLIKIERDRVWDYEQLVIKSFDLPLVVSEKTKEHLGGDEKIRVLKLGVEKSEHASISKMGVIDKPILMFSGNMGYYPNVDAVLHFTDKILPLIMKFFPAVIFKIIGVNPSNKVKRIRSENIIVTGKVQSIRKEMEVVDVMVAPMRSGAGTQNKILEAMASGIPVVTSKRGCEGLGDIDAVPVLVADNAEEFAEKLLSLLRDEGLRNNLIESGIKFVKDKHSWESIILDLECMLKLKAEDNEH